MPSNDIYPRYKLKNGHPDFVKTNNFYNKLWSFYTVRFFQDNFLERQLVKNKEKTFELMKAIFIASREAQKKHWNTDRFIIFKYRIFWPDREGYIDCAGEYTDVPEWHKLRDEGFEIIDMKDLAGNSMCSAEYVMSKMIIIQMKKPGIGLHLFWQRGLKDNDKSIESFWKIHAYFKVHCLVQNFY